MSNEKLTEIIKNIVDDNWLKTQEPVLLSQIPLLIEKQNEDYKSQLGGKSLQSFIKENGERDYCLIRHQEQKAKIGLIPAGKTYSFPPNNTTESKTTESKTTAPNKKDDGTNQAINLLMALSKIPNEDLEKINIPVSVIVKLFK